MTGPSPIRTVAFARCALHGSHSPIPLIAQLHHIFPKALQAAARGIDVVTLEQGSYDTTTVPLCGTGHDSVHELIRRILRGDKPRGRGKTLALARDAVAKYHAAGGA